MEVINMKNDLFLGTVIGVIVGLAFYTTLTPYLPFIVILGVLLMTKVIHVK